jgi:hypothetical protein
MTNDVKRDVERSPLTPRNIRSPGLHSQADSLEAAIFHINNTKGRILLRADLKIIRLNEVSFGVPLG